MLEVYTSNIKYYDNDTLNITRESSDGIGKLFAPTWDMVLGVKSGRYSEETYTEMYLELMRQSYKKNNFRWNEILQRERIVFVCYCKPNEFCHRVLLTEIFIKLGAGYKGEIVNE